MYIISHLVNRISPGCSRCSTCLQRPGHESGQPLAPFPRQNALHQRGEQDRRKRQGRNGHRGDRREGARATWARRWKISPVRQDRPEAGLYHRGNSRPRRHPAHLDDPHRQLALLHPAHLLGWRAEPSVEVPVGDFFACGLGKYGQISSLAVCVNPGSGFNSYWEMPFRKSAR